MTFALGVDPAGGTATRHVRRFAILAAVASAVVCSGVLTGAGRAAAGTHPVAGGARKAASGSTWGNAEEVPGTAALNQGGAAEITSVSCASAGHCSAGGDYQDGYFAPQSFVVNEINGRWGTAEELPGSAALSGGAGTGIYSLSCASAGNCSAGGYYIYYAGSYLDEAFVVDEKNGTWGTAQQVPGTAALNQGGGAGTNSVSCASAGNCSAGGVYEDGSGHAQAFVVNEVNGTWHVAQQVPGTAALNQGGGAETNSVSCASAGNCSAGGGYADASGAGQGFVVNEVNGTWGKAKQVAGLAALNKDGRATVEAVSCGAAGNCAAVGDYLDASLSRQVFVVNERNGSWGKAEEVPGTAALNKGTQTHDAQLQSLSCASAGNCSAAGSYQNDTGQHVFVVSETNGSWGKAREAPGTSALGDSIGSLSCGSAGNCSAVGPGFVIDQVNGTWQKAEAIPGLAALNQGGDTKSDSVSCASAGRCSAGGYYDDASGQQAFVVNER